MISDNLDLTDAHQQTVRQFAFHYKETAMPEQTATPFVLPTFEEVASALPAGEGWTVGQGHRDGAFALRFGGRTVGELATWRMCDVRTLVRESGGDSLPGWLRSRARIAEDASEPLGWYAKLFGGSLVHDSSSDFRVALKRLLG